LADYISKHDSLKVLVRIGLMPVVGASYVMLNTNPVQKILILMLILTFVAGLYFVIRRRRLFLKG
jgi:NADH:ubiquinone oxidoreductase subunit 6 (subunit J)